MRGKGDKRSKSDKRGKRTKDLRIKELLEDVMLYLILDGAVSFLFYRSVIAFAILLPGFFG